MGMDQVNPRRPPASAARAHLPWRGPAMTLLLLLGAMASAHGQIGGGHGRRQNNQQQTPQQSPAPTTPFLPEIWPRLEEGALICRSRDDLVKYQTQIANGSSAAALAQAPDCHTIRKQTSSRFWLTTVPHAPKSSRRTRPKKLGGPTVTCRRPRRLLSPKAQAHGNDWMRWRGRHRCYWAAKFYVDGGFIYAESGIKRRSGVSIGRNRQFADSLRWRKPDSNCWSRLDCNAQFVVRGRGKRRIWSGAWSACTINWSRRTWQIPALIPELEPTGTAVALQRHAEMVRPDRQAEFLQ